MEHCLQILPNFFDVFGFKVLQNTLSIHCGHRRIQQAPQQIDLVIINHTFSKRFEKSGIQPCWRFRKLGADGNSCTTECSKAHHSWIDRLKCECNSEGPVNAKNLQTASC